MNDSIQAGNPPINLERQNQTPSLDRNFTWKAIAVGPGIVAVVLFFSLLLVLRSPAPAFNYDEVIFRKTEFMKSKLRQGMTYGEFWTTMKEEGITVPDNWSNLSDQEAKSQLRKDRTSMQFSSGNAYRITQFFPYQTPDKGWLRYRVNLHWVAQLSHRKTPLPCNIGIYCRQNNSPASFLPLWTHSALGLMENETVNYCPLQEKIHRTHGNEQ